MAAPRPHSAPPSSGSPAAAGELDAFARELTRHQARLRGLISCLLFNRQKKSGTGVDFMRWF